jgi:glyoxylase-like metal-dependent hydrolase (beta-lactamase superfamily II)
LQVSLVLDQLLGQVVLTHMHMDHVGGLRQASFAWRPRLP